PTNNNLRTSSTSQSANKKQEFVKMDDKKVENKADEKKRDMSRVKCYNRKKEGHFAKDYKKVKVKDYEYYKTKSCLQRKIKMNNDLKNTVLEKDFKISELKECVRNKDFEIEKCLERLNVCENKLHKMGQTNQTVHMIMPSKDNLYNGKKGIGFKNSSYFEKAKDLRLKLYDEKVIGLGYTPMFLTHSDEALEIEKFKRSKENKIEFAYDYGNLNASYVNEKINFKDDYFQDIINPDFKKTDSPFQQTSSLKPYVLNVILEKIITDLEDEVVSSESENQSENDCLVVEKECDKEENPKKKGSSNTYNVGLSAVSVSNLNKNVKRYSRKDLLPCNNSDLEVGISQQFSAPRTPQQNGVVERRNRTLVEAARTMLTFANLPSFLWAEAIAIACFTQNRSIIHKHFDKTPYELINKRKPNIKFFHVFGCRCYLLNDYEDVGKQKAKGDIRVFVGYSKESAAFRIYNKRTRKIHESVNVNFDEISEMASKQFSLELGLSNLKETGKSSNPSVSKFLKHQGKIWKIYFKIFMMSILILQRS
nr:retrovirus-related Pol polyprotein from transposon TNT 1-94 [Tanacetum cinerariifolium]